MPQNPAFKKIHDDYQAIATDETILVDSEDAVELTMPDAQECPGHIIRVKNIGAGILTISFIGTQGDFDNIKSRNNGKSVAYLSDGDNWLVFATF